MSTKTTRLQKTSTSLALAIAALAVSATSVQAFSSHEFLTRAGLSDEQVVAVQAARELRQQGDLLGARDMLFEAGVDAELLTALRTTYTEFDTDEPPVRQRFWLDELSDDQLMALRVAQAANDRATVQAILDEAGIGR